jgi:hypothetical protein
MKSMNKEVNVAGLRVIAKRGIFALGDTNKGWEITLADGEGHKGKVWLTEGWVLVDGERVGRRLLLRGDAFFKNKINNMLNFLQRDTQWRDTFVCWTGLNEVMDLLMMHLLSQFEIIDFRKK